MSHEHTHGGEGTQTHDAAAAVPTPQAPFTSAECSAMRQDDVLAAKSVVLLMCGVFTAGLIMYSIVALTL